MAKTNRTNVEQQTTQAIIVLENRPTITDAELAEKGIGVTAIKAARRKHPYAKPTFVTEGERHALMGNYGEKAQAEAIAARTAPKTMPLPAGAKPAGTAKPAKPVAEAKPSKGSKPAKEPKTKDAAPAAPKGMSESRIKVLTLLLSAKEGLTRKEMADRTGIQKGWSKMLGSITKGDPAKGTLEGDGLVSSKVIEGQRGIVYTITAAGKAAVKSASK